MWRCAMPYADRALERQCIRNLIIGVLQGPYSKRVLFLY